MHGERQHAEMVDLTASSRRNVAVWLTDAGDVVGYADLPSSPPGCIGLACVQHGFLWRHGLMTDLGTLGGDPCNHAFMSNANGQVVGTSEAFCDGPGIHPFLWENEGPMVDLNTLIPEDSGAPLYEASNINERGEIVAGGLPAGCNDPSSCGHVYLLIPCDKEHRDLKGCDYDPVYDKPPAEVQPAQGMSDRVRSFPAKRNRRFPFLPQK